MSPDFDFIITATGLWGAFVIVLCLQFSALNFAPRNRKGVVYATTANGCVGPTLLQLLQNERPSVTPLSNFILSFSLASCVFAFPKGAPSELVVPALRNSGVMPERIRRGVISNGSRNAEQ